MITRGLTSHRDHRGAMINVGAKQLPPVDKEQLVPHRQMLRPYIDVTLSYIVYR
jgi:hypothetical protein